MRILRSGLASCVLTLWVTVAWGAPADPVYQLKIEAQPLANALQAFADQSGTQVMFFSEVPGGMKSKELVGRFTRQEALTALLAGTGLDYSLVNERTVTIKGKGSSNTAESDGQGKREAMKVAQETAATPSSSGRSSAQENASRDHEDSQEVKLQEIVVTSTRLNRQDVPTPLMTIGADQLREGGYTNPIAVLDDLPQFKATVTPNTTRTSGPAPGSWNVDLRGLGFNRTLSLIDGRRFVARYFQPDTGVVPMILIDHIDVVTGSASAAWGSNAVAGVVNFALNDKLEGLRFNAQYGESERGDGQQPHYEAAAGGFFADRKGHFMFGADFTDAQANDELVSRDGHYGSRANSAVVGITGFSDAIPNPAYTSTNGQKPFLTTNQFVVNVPTYSRGGLVRSGVNAGQTFNPDGSLRPFDFGTLATSAFGDFAINPEGYGRSVITAPIKRINSMGRVSYDVSDSLKVTADLLYSRVWNHRFPWIVTEGRANTISIENAFLSPAIRNQMTAAGQTSFSLGKYFDGPESNIIDSDAWITQANLALDGTLSERWRWTGYYGRGIYRDDSSFSNDRITANYAKALDSVLSPVTGQPVCRVNADVSTANDDPACVAYNAFGENTSSAAARSYVYGTAVQHNKQTLDTAGLTLRGEPFALPAGDLAVAVGAEWRRETADNRVDPISLARGFTTRNWAPILGDNTTKEGFTEVLLPVVKDLPILRQLNFNGAARYIDDKTASLWAWKLGFTDKLMEGVQLRFTTSKDVRAPNLFELYNSRSFNLANVIDRLNGGITTLITSFTGGNPALVPETSRTSTVGMTIEPSSISSLRFTVDYFDINIDNAISALSPQQVVDLCFQGSASACNTMVRDSSGVLTTINGSQINFVKLQVTGIDSTADYKLPFSWLGTWRLHSALTWTLKSKTDTGFGVTDNLGNNSANFNAGNVRLTGNVTLYYDRQHFQGYLTGRYISSGLDGGKAAESFLQNVEIPAYTYVDFGASLKLPSLKGEFQPEVFVNVNNVLNKEAPVRSYNTAYYDVIGRYYTLGARMRF